MIRHASKHASEDRQTSRQAGKEKVMKTLRHKVGSKFHIKDWPNKDGLFRHYVPPKHEKTLIFDSFCGLYVCFMKSQNYKMSPLSFLGQIKHSVNEVLPNLWMYKMNWFSMPTRGLY